MAVNASRTLDLLQVLTMRHGCVITEVYQATGEMYVTKIKATQGEFEYEFGIERNGLVDMAVSSATIPQRFIHAWPFENLVDRVPQLGFEISVTKWSNGTPTRILSYPVENEAHGLTHLTSIAQARQYDGEHAVYVDLNGQHMHCLTIHGDGSKWDIKRVEDLGKD